MECLEGETDSCGKWIPRDLGYWPTSYFLIHPDKKWQTSIGKPHIVLRRASGFFNKKSN